MKLDLTTLVILGAAGAGAYYVYKKGQRPAAQAAKPASSSSGNWLTRAIDSARQKTVDPKQRYRMAAGTCVDVVAKKQVDMAICESIHVLEGVGDIYMHSGGRNQRRLAGGVLSHDGLGSLR